jgi:hypothetical protein
MKCILPATKMSDFSTISKANNGQLLWQGAYLMLVILNSLLILTPSLIILILLVFIFDCTNRKLFQAMGFGNMTPQQMGYPQGNIEVAFVAVIYLSDLVMLLQLVSTHLELHLPSKEKATKDLGKNLHC